LVERFFNKIKHCRRVATRYDKLAANYLAFVQLASISYGCALMSPRPNQGIESQEYSRQCSRAARNYRRFRRKKKALML
jgi:hypothetical protein